MNGEQEEPEVPWWSKNGEPAVKIETWNGKDEPIMTLVLSIDEDGLPCVEVWEGDLENGKDEVNIGPHVFEWRLDQVVKDLHLNAVLWPNDKRKE